MSDHHPYRILRPLTALRRGLAALGRRPWLPLGFSALACGVNALGWALFAAGHGAMSGVSASLLKTGGFSLYMASLAWLVEGLTRIGLALDRGQGLTWRQLCRWPSASSRGIALGLLNIGLALAATSLGGFVAWLLVQMLLPALTPLPALLGLAAVLAVAMSQLFNSCLVVADGLSPSRAFRRGVELLALQWPGLLELTLLLLAMLGLPFALGVLAEGLRAGLGVAATLVALVAVLPALAGVLTAAYGQLRDPDGGSAPLSPAVR